MNTTQHVRPIGLLVFAFLLSIGSMVAQQPVRVIVIGAHPDDCDIRVGGTAALWTKAGAKVKFVTMTNGDKGHHRMQPEELAARRKKEYTEAGKRLGVEYIDLGNHDGELLPTLENRLKVIKAIREWDADVVITHRPNDYHPDHRYTGQLVMDAAYMVAVPLVEPSSKPIKKNPVFLYINDHFQRPNPSRPDICVDITPVYDLKLQAIDAHESQVYEWLPWIDGYSKPVPTSPSDRMAFLREFIGKRYYITPEMKENLAKWYHPVPNAEKVEAFEICEYGKQPTADEIRQLFPFFGK